MSYKMEKLPSPGKYKQKGEESPNKFIGLTRAIKGVGGFVKGFKDTEGSFKERAGAGLKQGLNSATGVDIFTEETPEGEESQSLTELKEQVEKNTYDISTIGGGAGSGLTYKGSINGEIKEVVSSQSNPLKKTGCVKKYK